MKSLFKVMLVMITFQHPACFALDASRLWLPQKYQKNYVALLTSAEAAEAIDRCVSVLEGTLDLSQSKKDHPIFRILCRQSNGRSYNEMVDGLSFETLTTPKPVVLELSEQELEQLRLEEAAKKAEQVKQLKASFWLACQAAAHEKTYLMQGLQWITQEEPEPLSFSEITRESVNQGGEELGEADKSLVDLGFISEAIYCLEFDAKNVQGQPLKYKALCHIDDNGISQLVIKKR